MAGAATTSDAGNNVALVQSIGGGGGGGGSGSGLFNITGGTGAAGGNGGSAGANVVNGSLVANGVASSGLIVQSIGGGGGIGGDATGLTLGVSLSIGGNGGLGGSGGAVTVTNGANALIASLDPKGDFGVLAQSIGGSGGAGGTATTTGVGFFAMSVGGDSGAGAPSGTVNVTNAGLITTDGSFGDGIQAQSIGGGGGDGGAGISNVAGIVPVLAVSIGGRGGGGGAANTVTVLNGSSGQITTYGSNAYGILAQSIGGGGGTGGLATSRAVSFTVDPDVPAFSAAFALGGSGGAGNTGAAATATNNGFIATSGEGSNAMVAQSVGGGGGAGGDATALSYSGGNNDAGVPSITASVAIGGSGGVGGTGGAATLVNTGLVMTLGTDAVGLMAQSVGGGGGFGGAGDTSAVSNDPEDSQSLAITLSVGGRGGTGGTGGQVSLDNSGSIITRGDGAAGFFAQSVGGGGGAGGGGVANAASGTVSIAVGLGGSGGAGGNGGAVTATNEGAIVTRGVDADGMFAQSVGGGGGVAGKGGATSGGVDNVAKSSALADTIAGGLNADVQVTTVIDGVFKIGSYIEMLKTIDEVADIFGQIKPTANTDPVVANLNLSVSVGGSGGAAGDGGAVTLTNAYQISTYGAQSDGVYAQSVGGGGGKGGDASSVGSSYDDTVNQLGLGASGRGGAAGNGGTIRVANASGAEIIVRGVDAFGILGQSIGGGGGTAGNAQAVNGSLRSLAIAFDATSGAQGSGGAVTIENDGSITTQGKDGVGILGQSIGGGGGIAVSMTDDMTFDPGDLANNPQGRYFDIQGASVTFGGGTNAQGDGGAVNITNAGSISTALRDAHGILAQSIGGGGGATIGGQLLGGLKNGSAAANTNNGNGGAINVTLKSGASIATMGDGAYGVLAQSIGGGGGLSGDLSNVATASTTLTGGVIVAGTGAGGNVTVGLNGASITTTGAFAPGILAQSVGGGGGVIAQNGGGLQAQGNTLEIGAAGGSGVGGVVTVSLVNSTIKATGATGSPAIVVYSNSPGDANGSSIVNIDEKSSVQGGANSSQTDPGFLNGAIALLNPQGAVVNNAGTITGLGGTAISSAGQATINNMGQINGNIALGGLAGSTVNNDGTLAPNGRIALSNNPNTSAGTLNNTGTLIVGTASNVGQLTIAGSLNNTGRIQISIGPGANFSSIQVDGTASVGGLIYVLNATNAGRGPSGIVVNSPNPITALPSVASDNVDISFEAMLTGGNALFLDPIYDFSGRQKGLSSSKTSLAGYLDTAFSAGDPGLASGLGMLLDAAKTQQANSANLATLAGQSLLAVSAIRYESSLAQARALYTCPNEPDGSTTAGEHACAWFRIQGDWANSGRDRRLRRLPLERGRHLGRRPAADQRSLVRQRPHRLSGRLHPSERQPRQCPVGRGLRRGLGQACGGTPDARRRHRRRLRLVQTAALHPAGQEHRQREVRRMGLGPTRPRRLAVRQRPRLHRAGDPTRPHLPGGQRLHRGRRRAVQPRSPRRQQLGLHRNPVRAYRHTVRGLESHVDRCLRRPGRKFRRGRHLGGERALRRSGRRARQLPDESRDRRCHGPRDRRRAGAIGLALRLEAGIRRTPLASRDLERRRSQIDVAILAATRLTKPRSRGIIWTGLICSRTEHLEPD